MIRFHIRFLMNVGCCYAAWFYVPLFNFKHLCMALSFHLDSFHALLIYYRLDIEGVG